MTNGCRGKTVFSSRRNADCSALVSRNWQELTTSEPSGLDKVASSVASKWHLAAPTRNPIPSRLPPGISNTNPNISTIDQRLIRSPEEVADCGQNHWISLMPIKCKKNQTSPSDAVHALMTRLCCTAKYPMCIKLAQCHCDTVDRIIGLFAFMFDRPTILGEIQ